MSVAVLTGTTSLTENTHSYIYQSSVPVTAALPLRPALPAAEPQTSFTRTDKKSFITTTIQPYNPAQTNSHRHSRTNSSNTLPREPFRSGSSQRNSPKMLGSPPSSYSHTRNSSVPSVMSMQRQSITSPPRRSTSSRSTSTNSPSSYVALMRKQKATVWCDRAQNIDPRVAAAQKAAKRRAQLEVQGNANPGSGRTSTINSSGVVSKIRHGGNNKSPAYIPANLTGAGPPLRLSANEMLGDEEEERTSLGTNSMKHARTGSGRSSTNSARHPSGYTQQDSNRYSNTSTPPSGGEGDSPGDKPNLDASQRRYSHHRKESSGENEDSFGDFKDLSAPSAVDKAMQQGKSAEELRRRGSVDERAMSMGGVRLFVANPDIDD